MNFKKERLILYKSIKVFIYVVFLCQIPFQAAVLAEIPNVQPEFIITKEDIQNAIPTEADVFFTKKTAHEIEVMEKRHFEQVNDYDSPKYRVAKLENYLLRRTWEFSPINTRVDRLKLASQRKMLSGTSLPVGIRRYVSPQRIANDSTPIYENDDNVGIIDGLLKLYMPDVYYSWSNRKKRINERYNDG